MPESVNQYPEQVARDRIDEMLKQSGWVVQDMKSIDLTANDGVAVKEYYTDIGPADYLLFAGTIPLGIIEAKKETEGYHLTVHEEQAKNYSLSKLKYLNNDPLPFVYESTGTITRFTNFKDPKPRSREIFSFHTPASLLEWYNKEKSLRGRFQNIPELDTHGLRECQIQAIKNLEKSFKENRPRALIQMATGAGKTYTAITFIYRLLKFANAKRILFLVDTKNLGEQAEQEFMSYLPPDDNRKFTELYNVQRLKSSYIAEDSQVCISTIQRLYSILKGEELDESAEETNPAESSWRPSEPVPVVYNENIPVEFFDFIVIDECHRSIYNLWKQVLDYFDSFLIGLTATPDKRTFGFFNQNIVSEYSHEQAIADNVNVGYNVFLIKTQITRHGADIKFGEYVDKREKLTRKKRWEQLDEPVQYAGRQLDRDVVNPDQIRTIIKTFKNKIPELFKERKEVPKTLIFAKTDSHAEDIIQITREEFGEENEFCKKITYNAENPKSTLAQFRNDYNPRIAVTVDMIATGTDVKPLECLIFMRDVRSKNYFEQMKGRGTRVISLDDLRRVTPSAKNPKDHFVIIDAVGVSESLKTDSRPLERKPNVPLKDLLNAITVGSRDEDLYLSLANRLARLNSQIDDGKKEKIKERAKGKNINTIIKDLLNAFNPDEIEKTARIKFNIEDTLQPEEKHLAEAQNLLKEKAASSFNGELNTYIDNVRRELEQIIDTINPDTLIFSGWDAEQKANAKDTIKDFKEYIEQHKDEIIALQIFYSQPNRRKELTYRMINELLLKIKSDKPAIAPLIVWDAYDIIDKLKYPKPDKELTALVSLIRKVTGIDRTLTPYDKTVDKNFQKWVMNRHKGNAPKFNEEQMQWLRMIKEHISTSFHLDKDDLDYAPFDSQGGLSKMWQLFGNETENIINELNEVLAA